jgi:hypothetical protein
MVAAHSADVISIGSRADWCPDFKGIAAQQLRAAREGLGLDRAAFAAVLTELAGWPVAETALVKWERGAIPPGDVLLAAQGSLTAPPGSLLAGVPHSFPATALAGAWVTSYQFTHNGEPCHHADIAHVTAGSDRHIRAVNRPAESRTEGRAVPFCNDIEAQLASRHLVGHWKNTSDARYFGSVQLAVLPGEMVMEGHYTGFASDILVSRGYWRWVRLAPESVTDGVALAEPAALHKIVMSHSAYDAPLTIADIGEAA